MWSVSFVAAVYWLMVRHHHSCDTRGVPFSMLMSMSGYSTSNHGKDVVGLSLGAALGLAMGTGVGVSLVGGVMFKILPSVIGMVVGSALGSTCLPSCVPSLCAPFLLGRNLSAPFELLHHFSLSQLVV